MGSIDSVRRLDYTAIGDVVNTAQRLQSIAVGGQILLSVATRACLDGVTVDALGPKQVKGKREAIEVFSLAAG